jgi:hypothetical protein
MEMQYRRGMGMHMDRLILPYGNTYGMNTTTRVSIIVHQTMYT